MKKLAVAILLSFAVIAGSSFAPDNLPSVAYAQKKDDKGGRKNPPGPPVIRDKGPKGGQKPKEPPPRKKPD
jgi:hypothetical protein